MNKTNTNIVIYPARGFLGATNVVAVRGDLKAIRAAGATDAARFDLAVEVPARKFRGVAAPQFFASDVPAAFRASWAVVSATEVAA
jgi:hypothetical protein